MAQLQHQTPFHRPDHSFACLILFFSSGFLKPIYHDMQTFLSHDVLNQENLDELAAQLKILAHPDRLKITLLLSRSTHTVSELVEALGISQSGTSNHLRLMRQAGIIQASRQGQFIHYRMNSQTLNHWVANFVHQPPASPSFLPEED